MKLFGTNLPNLSHFYSICCFKPPESINTYPGLDWKVFLRKGKNDKVSETVASDVL